MSHVSDHTNIRESLVSHLVADGFPEHLVRRIVGNQEWEANGLKPLNAIISYFQGHLGGIPIIDTTDITIGTIIIGDRTKEDLIATLEKQCEVAPQVIEIIHQPSFVMVDEPTSVDLILGISAAKLMRDDKHRVPLGLIYDKGFELGFGSCHPEVGLQLALQYGNLHGKLRVVMDPVLSVFPPGHKFPVIFMVTTGETGKILLTTRSGSRNDSCAPHNSFVFTRRIVRK